MVQGMARGTWPILFSPESGVASACAAAVAVAPGRRRLAALSSVAPSSLRVASADMCPPATSCLSRFRAGTRDVVRTIVLVMMPMQGWSVFP
jgi:hypothetical protein